MSCTAFHYFYYKVQVWKCSWDTSALTPEYTIEVKKGSPGLNYSVNSWDQSAPLRETLWTPPLVFFVSISGLLTASSWFLLNSCPDITPLAWWRSGPDYCDGGRRQSLTTDFRHSFPYPRFAPYGLFELPHNRTTEGACALPPNSTTPSPGFLSNQNHMRCKFTGKLRSPFGSGSKTFSQRTTRWDGEWTVAAAAAAGPPRDGLCVYDRRVPANAQTVTVLLLFFPAELLLAAWQRLYCWIQLGAGSALTRAGCYLCFRERFVWKQSRGGKKRRSLASPSPYDCSARSPLNLPGFCSLRRLLSVVSSARCPAAWDPSPGKTEQQRTLGGGGGGGRSRRRRWWRWRWAWRGEKFFQNSSHSAQWWGTSPPPLPDPTAVSASTTAWTRPPGAWCLPERWA